MDDIISIKLLYYVNQIYVNQIYVNYNILEELRHFLKNEW